MMRLIGIDASSSGLASHSAESSSSGSGEPAFPPWAKELAVVVPNQRPIAAAAVAKSCRVVLMERNEHRARSGVRSTICVLPDIFGAMKRPADKSSVRPNRQQYERKV